MNRRNAAAHQAQNIVSLPAPIETDDGDRVDRQALMPHEGAPREDTLLRRQAGAPVDGRRAETGLPEIPDPTEILTPPAQPPARPEIDDPAALRPAPPNRIDSQEIAQRRAMDAERRRRRGKQRAEWHGAPPLKRPRGIGLLTGAKSALARFLFASPLYRPLLWGRAPRELRFAPPDPWAGDSARGSAILHGQFRFAGQSVQSMQPIWWPRGATRGWLEEMHGFGWLRDLRAVGSDEARRRARDLVSHWIDDHGRWRELAWDPEVIGARVAAWLSQYEFFAASASDAFRRRYLRSLAMQVRHLARTLPGDRTGLDLLAAIKGLLYAGVTLPRGDRRIERAVHLLERELPRQVLADGGYIHRSPASQLAALRHLVDIRAAMVGSGRESPDIVQGAIDRMAPMLRFFRHADGRLALFNSASEGESWRIEMVLNQADMRGKPPQQAPHSGFQRLQANRTLILMDVGAAPRAGLDEQSHAGALSFEMSVAKDRFIVNCGAPTGGEWRDALRATAAHSTLTVDDRNSCELLPGGGVGRRPSSVTCRRETGEGNIWLEASHDGYRRSFGLIHMRRLFLAANGEDLRGEDVLNGRGGERFSIRFHLHPSVRATVNQAGNAVLMRLAGGMGWRMVAAGARIGLSGSVYCGAPGELQRAKQIVIYGQLTGEGARVKWALRREGSRSG